MFEKGNNVWMMRSKHGRDKIFATPEDMWAAFVEYTQKLSDNPWLEHKQVVVDKVLVDSYNKKTGPWTWKGFCIHCDINDSFFRDFRNDPKRCTPDFDAVIKNIEKSIFDQKFSGAALGFFNANIIARDLGLIDKSIQETRTRVIDTGLTADEAKNIAEGLESEF